MTAAITGSGPLAALLCNSAEPSIVNGLRATARRCRDIGLHVRMYVLDDPADQREVLLMPVRVLIWDGHSSWDDGPGVDGSPPEGVFGRDSRRITAEALVIGCCWGAASDFTDVIRRYLAAPTAYVGCQRQPGKTHGAIVFPPLLDAVASLQPGTELGTRVQALREALGKTAADRQRSSRPGGQLTSSHHPPARVHGLGEPTRRVPGDRWVQCLIAAVHAAIEDAG